MIDVYKDMNTLTKLNIFSKFPLEHLEHLLKCCGAYYKFYDKNQIVFLQGNKVDSLCIIISGSVSIEKIDILGNNTYKILCLPFHKKYSTDNCKNTCACRLLFRENLLNEIVENNMLLINKLEILSKKNIREKIMTFLAYESEKYSSNKVKIPFSKSKFAEYLGVNRSSLMRELSNMKNEGIIELNNKSFTIL